MARIICALLDENGKAPQARFPRSGKADSGCESKNKIGVGLGAFSLMIARQSAEIGPIGAIKMISKCGKCEPHSKGLALSATTFISGSVSTRERSPARIAGKGAVTKR